MSDETRQSFSSDDAVPEPVPEIERTFLLDGLPDMPPGVVTLIIEQGYFPEVDPETDPAPDVMQGRLRRTEHADGRVSYTHTIKSGAGLIREEINRELTREEFERWWPHTEKRRLTKMRYCIAQASITWEIDAFDGLNLVLVDVELPTPQTRIDIPDWLAKRIVREVTDEPEYRNYELALQTLAKPAKDE